MTTIICTVPLVETCKFDETGKLLSLNVDDEMENLLETYRPKVTPKRKRKRRN